MFSDNPIALKEVLAFTAMAINAVISLGYIYKTVTRKIKPHMFSWLIWGTVQIIAAAAQYADNGGAGAVVTLFGGAMCLFVAVTSIRLGEKNIVTKDWIAFFAALSAIPLWIATKNPLTATILMSIIDVLGSYPTIRKAYEDPFHESALYFSICAILLMLGFASIENYSLTTTIYPITIIAINVFVVGTVVIRKKQLSAEVGTA